MNRSFFFAALTILSALATFSSVSCDAVDEAFDCKAVCERYRDCYDSGYDVSGCESRCRTRAANDPSVKAAADTCDSCIDDMSCASATFSCAGSCGTIVP